MRNSRPYSGRARYGYTLGGMVVLGIAAAIALRPHPDHNSAGVVALSPDGGFAATSKDAPVTPSNVDASAQSLPVPTDFPDGGSVPAPAADTRAAEAYIARAQQLFSGNRSENINATRQGLEEAAAEIEKALAVGYADRVGAYKTLGEVERQIALWGGGNSPDSVVWKAKAREAFAKALELQPDDVQARLRYSGLLASPEEQLGQLRIVLSTIRIMP